MKQLYIFTILLVKGEPPNSQKMLGNKEYNFTPFNGEAIYTIDSHIGEVFKGKLTSIFTPTRSECNVFFEKTLSSKMKVLFGLLDKKILEIPGRGLVDLEPFKYDLMDVGYDVIDLFGFSAITNIGYSTEAVDMILDLNIDVNEYGLISNKDDAVKFTKFADSYATEHAPFMPLIIKLKDC